jgi:hypothetical protein
MPFGLSGGVTLNYCTHLQTYEGLLFQTDERRDDVVESEKFIETCFAYDTMAL